MAASACSAAACFALSVATLLDCLKASMIGAGEGNQHFRSSKLLRPEANFIKLTPFRVADDKDIPRMDYIAQGLRD